MEVFSPYFFAVVAGFGLPQLFKSVWASLRDRRLRWRVAFDTGGMPSSHSSLVTALALTIGAKVGWGSPIFVLAAVWAAIVIYDSAHVRRAVGEQGVALRGLLLQRGPGAKTRPDTIPTGGLDEPYASRGHTPAEVLAGMACGAVIAVVVALLT
ncbi:MAG: divergent PAP2 family protein [Propionibacteriaceae bacterium]|jgi:acid phosphatase family membrane protein YuiD|nr:divergent PAP2 family protein [Propionibacteriaceae bacterium]